MAVCKGSRVPSWRWSYSRSRTDHPLLSPLSPPTPKIEFGFACQSRSSFILVSGTVRFRHQDPLWPDLAGCALLTTACFYFGRAGSGSLLRCGSLPSNLAWRRSTAVARRRASWPLRQWGDCLSPVHWRGPRLTPRRGAEPAWPLRSRLAARSGLCSVSASASTQLRWRPTRRSIVRRDTRQSYNECLIYGPLFYLGRCL